jgi:hypothetical protein
MGRAKLELDRKLIEELAGLACTVEEISRLCKCSKDTLERNYMEHIETGRANVRASIRRTQYQIAMDPEHKGQTTMLIWLGKQLCGQRDFKADLTDLTDEQLASELRRRMDSGKLPP